MIKKFCDRCKKEICGNHYSISLGCIADKTGRVPMMGGALNLEENFKSRMLCEECIFDIKDYIDNKPILDKKNKRRH